MSWRLEGDCQVDLETWHEVRLAQIKSRPSWQVGRTRSLATRLGRREGVTRVRQMLGIGQSTCGDCRLAGVVGFDIQSWPNGCGPNSDVTWGVSKWFFVGQGLKCRTGDVRRSCQPAQKRPHAVPGSLPRWGLGRRSAIHRSQSEALHRTQDAMTDPMGCRSRQGTSSHGLNLLGLQEGR